jgi:hypothetical protein
MKSRRRICLPHALSFAAMKFFGVLAGSVVTRAAVFDPFNFGGNDAPSSLAKRIEIMPELAHPYQGE